MNYEYQLVIAKNAARETEALIRNALEYLAEARSTVIDHLSAPNDIYARLTIVQDLGLVEDNLRKALN
ncbi:hypothetical protein SEA_HANNACONDA_97 [Mycobacterium phage Hannaconda]|nr:hypothetical protein SEA_HANNACONDA_97 [Mycobacterium phage Hannaconda]